jgi:hypothetical protein
MGKHMLLKKDLHHPYHLQQDQYNVKTSAWLVGHEFLAHPISMRTADITYAGGFGVFN